MELLTSIFSVSGHDLNLLRKKYRLGQYLNYKGKKIHYVDEGQGKVILAIHGTSDSLRTWDELAKKLTDNFRVIRIDLPGFGLSDNFSVKDFWPERISNIITRLCEHLEVTQLSLIGNSLGGYYAWNFAVHRPEMIEKIYLLAPFAFDLAEYPLLVKIGKTKLAKFLSERFPSKTFVRYILSTAVTNQKYLTEEVVQMFYDFAYVEGRPALYNALFSNISHLPFLTKDKLELFVEKLVLIWGEQDRWLSPNDVHKWPEVVDGKKIDIHLLPSVGHLPQIDSPTRIKEIIEKSISVPGMVF